MKSRFQAFFARFGRGTLRAHLFALVLVSVLPILIFALLVLNLFARQERVSLATGLRETARALTSALDREFEATRTALEAVASLEDLDTGDLGDVYRKLRRVLQSRTNWKTVILHNRSGDQVLNLLNPFGEPLPEGDADRESLQAVLRTNQPATINLHKDPTLGWIIGYRVPVMRAGELKYVLSAEMSPDVIRDILGRQKLPVQTVSTITDAQHRIVASSGSRVAIGELAGPLERSAAPDQLDGWFEGRNKEGVASYAAHSRSAASSWSVNLVIAAAQLEAPLKRSIWALGGAGVIFLVAGIVGAVIVESRISEPLSDLTRKAEALGQGIEVSATGVSPIAEMENLNRDIYRAAELLAERGRDRDRFETALRELNNRLELRIAERTEQLRDTNSELRREIRERHAAEAALRSEHIYLNLLRSAESRSYQASGIEAALKFVLEETCSHLNWPVGYFLVSSADPSAFRSANDERAPFWFGAKNRPDLADFRAEIEAAAALGGDPATAAFSSQRVCTIDLGRSDEPWARAAAGAGLASVCAIAVYAGGLPAVGLAFFSEQAVELDSRLSAVLEQLALQLERAIERKQADEALRLSEEQFRLAFDEGPIGICMIDSNLRALRVNRAFCNLLGAKSDELLGRSFAEFVSLEDRAASEDRVERLFREGGGSYAVESRLVARSGEVLTCRITGTLITSAVGAPRYALKMIEDITQRKRMEEKLRESERLAAVGATSALFAHEVGNPLNGISTTVQVIQRDLARAGNGVQPSVVGALSDITQEITRLGALLHEFRYLARPQRLELAPVRLDELISATLRPNTYAERKIELVLDVPANLPSLCVDQDKLKQAIINLADNAADAMPKGGTLTIHGYRAGDEICIDVADTGTGIEAGVNVFELFRTTKPHGTGLGLAVVRQIVAAHNGRVKYHSEPGHGTIFTLALPLKEDATAAS